MWYSRSGGAKGRDFARDQRYKLYRDGNFYDVLKDPLEKRPLPKVTSEGSYFAAQNKLIKALALYRNARTITSTKLLGEKKKKTQKTRY